MHQWRWLDKRLLIILHDESLALHGGASGIRDEGLLDSALNRAVNLAHYGEPDFAELAATYGVGLAKNHAFVDGNKRVAFLAMGLFLGMNGYKLKATPVDATLTMLGVASGEMPEAEFADWIRVNSTVR
jgi:death on curing protein